MNSVKLAPRGTIVSYTTVMQSPPGCAFEPPYTLAYVKQKDGALFLCTSPETDVFEVDDEVYFITMEVTTPDGPRLGLIVRRGELER